MSNPFDLDQPPTDSVLRRHYEQLRAARSAAPPAAAPSAAPRPASAPAPTRAAPPAAPPEPPAQGVRGWLGRLFGG